MAQGLQGLGFQLDLTDFDPNDPQTRARIAQMFPVDPGSPGAAPGDQGGMDGDSPERKPLSPEEARIKALEDQLEQLRMQRQEQVERERRDARDAIKRVLSQYNLESLSDFLWSQYTEQYVDVSNPDAVVFAIKEQDAYKKRFAANSTRIAKGLPELDPSTYLQMEDAYRTVLRSQGMPEGFYDNVDDFQKFIEGDVSAAELNDRLQEGYRVVADADQEVKNQMKRLYGVSEGQLAAYFIDPDRAKPFMVASDYQRQARASTIAARAQEQGKMTITGDLAEELARRGVSSDEASSGFQEIGALGELRQAFAGEESLTEEQIARQQFGADVQSKEVLERRRRGRIGEFAGGGRYAQTQGETSGATRLGVGKAQ